MILTVIAAFIAIGVILLVARKSYSTGYTVGYIDGTNYTLDEEEKRRLDKAHMNRFGAFIKAGREGRN